MAVLTWTAVATAAL